MEWKFAEEMRSLETGKVDGASEIYAKLLERCPVAHVKIDGRIDYVGIFGYDTLIGAAEDTETFSSVVPLRGPRILPLQSDPPEHSDYRSVFSQLFVPSRIAAKELEVRKMAGDMIDAMIEKGTADFGQEFAYPFPTRVLCKFLGIPDSDWKMHDGFIRDLEHRSGHGLASPDEVPYAPAQEFVGYLFGLIADRRAKPGDDPVSSLLAARFNDKQLEEPEVAQLSVALLMAGHVTTTSATGNIVLRLAQDQKLQATLREDPSRIRDAIEEGLRIDSPQQAMPRRCRRETEVHGETIMPGDNILLNFASANLDPAHWDKPGSFDIDRADRRHVAFGRGVHQCPGAPLARLELRVLLEELLARTNSFEVVGEIERLTWPRLSVERMPLKFVPCRK